MQPGKRMQILNSQQQQAIHYLDGPLLVIAGAGSGKTRVITHKIRYLIDTCEFSPHHIYALTFTNKAAREMQARIAAMHPQKQRRKVNISTFHALGLVLLKQEAVQIGLHKNFTVLDTIDAKQILQELAGTPLNEETLNSAQHSISQWKNNLISPLEALNGASDEKTAATARLFLAYDKALLAYNAVDFDDLIRKPVMLLQTNTEVLTRWQNKVRYLLIDEYQDTNPMQYQLIRLLSGARAAFTAVGDDDQSIYAWRGASAENMHRLQQDYPGLRVVKLEQNYRSMQSILQVANHLIGHNPHLFEKKLWSTLGYGTPVRVIATAHEQDEVERVVHEILSHQFRTRAPFSDYAVLYRSNHQARPLEQALREQRIPYQQSGGISFFARTEIKDLFAYFRLMINPHDDAAFLRCVNTPRRDIGSTTLEKIGAYAKGRQCSLLEACQEFGLSEFLPEKALQRVQQFATLILRTAEHARSDHTMQVIENFIQSLGYREYLSDSAPNPTAAQKRLENVQALLQWLGKLTLPEQEAPLSFTEAIQKMTLIDMLDRQSEDEHANAVQLLTLHAAKGLEFAHVFIIGFEEECLPHKNSIEADAIEEERRLAYVGMTRAQQTLSLLYAKQRKRFGELLSTTPSRFLEELPSMHLERVGMQEASPEAQKASGQAHLANLRALLEKPL